MRKNATMPWRIIAGLLVIVALLVGTIVLVSNHSNPDKQGLQVVAAENFWGNIAGQIGGNHVHVTSIITDPTADPHLYESNAQNAAAVSSAKVVIVNGLGYDDFMSKLLNASKNSDRQVLTVASILNVSGDNANAHLWYDIPKVHLVAERIAASYEAKDPAHRDDYQANLAKFETSLQPLVATISTIKQRYAGAPVAYTEPVPGYLLAAVDLSVQTPEGFAKAIEDGADPSPADSQATAKLMTDKRVKVLLYNSQATSPVTQHVQNLAKQSGVSVIGVTETLPTNEKTYQSWIQDELNVLLKALQS